MTTTLAGREAHEPAKARWNLELLTAAEPERRNRRTGDAVLLAVAALLAGATAVVASSAPEQDEDVAHALVTILGWAGPLWRSAFVAALVGSVVIVLAALVRRRWHLARDLAVAVLVVAAIGSVLSGVVESDLFAVKAALWARWGFPSSASPASPRWSPSLAPSLCGLPACW